MSNVTAIPTAPAAQPAAQAAPSAPQKPKILPAIVLGLVALLGLTLVLYAWRLPPFVSAVQHTDNAYVRGQVTVISPQVSGYVASVPVQDYQQVEAGQVLAVIDDRIYRQRLEQALAGLHAAQAELRNSAQSQASARGSVAQTGASIAGAQAQAVKAKADADRARSLFSQGWVAQAQVDVTQAALRAAEAQLAQARAQQGIAQTSVTSAVVSKDGLAAKVENAEAQVQLAQIDLDNTRIRAPRAGQLGEVSVRQGQQVATGAQLMSLVPDRLWVVANLKEAQLKNVRVGQPVELAVDALGGQVLHGRVERIAPATGSEFSVIRPDNATGNFTKVAQRVPVRIAIDADQALSQRLRPGLSVTARIDTHAS